ncbi:flagellar basal body P-ring protein FlgI [Fuerstiella marisgermanici]|uniref:Flagellar P-ring protein n=1 Tax=Fuerstiella marisgermanici TaxID=1891926 RepID=A0A1P8WA77_9PLAN|nr:flagellar basal body P-ring protein FlgI [Fuerstiella marisgermanici]APZ90934.1 Basal body P-ring protein [Fuerstiella marisgermanici]
MRNSRRHKALALLATFALTQAFISSASAQLRPMVQVRDITDIAGEHPNELTGLGLVTGLDGTGGKSESTKRAAVEVLQKMGLRADPETRALIQQAREKTDNISVVIVKAMLKPHAMPGQRIDVVVSTLDDAESLNGGQLLRTPLVGVDGQVYALASGSISTNGGNFGGQAATITKNHATVGRIPNGAIVEHEVPTKIIHKGKFHLLLHEPSVETASRVCEAINMLMPDVAWIETPGMVSVHIPQKFIAAPFQYIAECLKVRITPDAPARVIINERTGTVVFTENVRLSPIAITHGNLIVRTMESPQVSQPEPFSDGQTAIVPRTEVDVMEETRAINVMSNTSTVHDLAASLNALGVSPRDLSAIFQMLKESGALHAELEIK